MTKSDHIVYIVDDDARIREALSELLEAHGIRAVAYGSAGEYVRAEKPDLPASLILDVELPDSKGRSATAITRRSFSLPGMATSRRR
jgi:FixJ family two-component response regulator